MRVPRSPRLRLLLGAALVGTVLLGATIGTAVLRRGPASPAPAAPPPRATFVGSAVCGSCHAAEHGRWFSSHHRQALLPATPENVLGDFTAPPLIFAGETTSFRRDGERFLLVTEGAAGAPVEVPVGFTLGVWPLQQVLVPHVRGRWQAHLVAWDAREKAQGGQRWFRLQPEEGRLPPTDLFHSLGPLQNWNGMCAECHSTGVRKGYDAATDAYTTTAAEHGVGCEACHGAGSEHVAWARALAPGTPRAPGSDVGLLLRLKEPARRTWTLDAARGIWRREPPGDPEPQVSLCARCHSRRGTIAEDDPGAPLHDTHRVALLEEGLYFADGQVQDEVFEHGSFLQSRMYAAGVACSDCHDHGSVARTEGAAASCARCHVPERYATRAHTFHAPDSPGSRCVDCHMPPRTYMVVHARRDHSIRIPRPDLSVTLGTPNACNGCHTDRDAPWAQAWVERWWGPGVARRPHYAPALHAGRQGAPGAADALAALIADRTAPAIVRATAASLLVRTPGPAVLPALAAAAADADPLVRRGAVEGGAGLPPAQRWPLLGPLLADPARVVRIDAARRLAGTPAPAPGDGQRLATALAEARTAAALSADLPDGLRSLGDLAVAAGDLVEGERCFREVLRRTPDYAPAALNLADLLRQQGREAEARQVLELALAAAPRSAALHHALGLAWVRARRMDAAGAALERAAAQAPDDAAIALAQALWLDAAGEPRRAREALERALRSAPYAVDVLFALAALAERDGDRPAALSAYARLQRLRPWDEDLRAARERLEGRPGR